VAQLNRSPPRECETNGWKGGGCANRSLLFRDSRRLKAISVAASAHCISSSAAAAAAATATSGGNDSTSASVISCGEADHIDDQSTPISFDVDEYDVESTS